MNAPKTAEIVHLNRGGPVPSSVKEWTDDQIVDGLMRGDSRAADALYDRVHDVVQRAVGQVVGRSDTDIDDLMQVAFERLIHSLANGRFARACTLRAWASVLASRVAIDALRGRKRERAVFDKSSQSSEQVPSTRDVRPTPERDADARLQLQSLRGALSRMKSDKAVMVYLHDVMGHDLTEAARLTGVSVSAAQSRLVRGRKELLRRYAAGVKAAGKEPSAG
ncbi:MAG: hypothetical protein RJA70_1506 [Pseudomonadota bacterium]|jgi:RNA polymerase sigma-70 factor (ECF subfamily)